MGWFRLFEVGLYEVLIHSQCVIVPTVEAGWHNPREDYQHEAKQCVTVDWVSNKMYFSHIYFKKNTLSAEVNAVFRIFSLLYFAI